MGKKKNNVQKKSIGNFGLLGMSLAVLILGAIWAYWSFIALPLKQSFKDAQYKLLKDSGINSEADYQKILSLPILMYHHVGPLPLKADQLRRDLTVSAENFELEAAWLKGQGYESISLNDLLLYKQGKFKLPEKPVIFTFDDGYKDVFDYAVPILKKYGFTGSFGIITQFPGITQGTNEYASWKQIAQAKQDGMEIISHSQDHFDGTNPKYDDNFIFRNLTDSQSDLLNNIGSALPIMIYPFGHFNSAYIRQAERAGFKMGLTVESGKQINMDNLMEIPRIRMHGSDDLERFKRAVQ